MFIRQDLARRRVPVRGPMRGQRRARSGRAAIASALAVGAVCISVAVPPPAVAVPRTSAVTFTRLKLLNGWQTYIDKAHPAVADIAGIITFKGDAANGHSPVLFTLPRPFRPATNVYIATALCSSSKGELHIRPTGVVTVRAEGPFSDATCVTELDGISFAKSAASFTKLKLRNGWQNAPNHTSAAAVRRIGAIVHLKGAIHTHGTNSTPFILPSRFRPAAIVYVPVDLCNARKGRLQILPTGVVIVAAEVNFSDAACRTSLDGVTFATSAASFTKLTPATGWEYYGFSTYQPAAQLISGIVHFEGAIKASVSSPGTIVMTLPPRLRPTKQVYIEVDLCNVVNGRLYIQVDGVVNVFAENSDLGAAQCFTSLDGAWFAR